VEVFRLDLEHHIEGVALVHVSLDGFVVRIDIQVDLRKGPGICIHNTTDAITTGRSTNMPPGVILGKQRAIAVVLDAVAGILFEEVTLDGHDTAKRDATINTQTYAVVVEPVAHDLEGGDAGFHLHSCRPVTHLDIFKGEIFAASFDQDAGVGVVTRQHARPLDGDVRRLDGEGWGAGSDDGAIESDGQTCSADEIAPDIGPR